MEGNLKMIAKTFFGFEPILAKELRDLGAMDVKEGNRMVSFVYYWDYYFKLFWSLYRKGSNMAICTTTQILNNSP